jgi:hypothetical protein
MGDFNDLNNKQDNPQSQNNQDINPQPPYQQTGYQQPPYQQPPYQQPPYQQPPYQQPPYQQQQYQTPPPQPEYQYQQNYQQYQEPEVKKSSGMAIASMVLGIVSFIFSCVFYISIPAGIVGLILGIISLKNRKGGKGMAIAGVILSGIGLLIAIIVVITAASLINNPYLSDLMQEFEYYDYTY